MDICSLGWYNLKSDFWVFKNDRKGIVYMRVRDFLILGVIAYVLCLALKYIRNHKNVYMGCSDCSKCRSKFCEKKDSSD